MGAKKKACTDCGSPPRDLTAVKEAPAAPAASNPLATCKPRDDRLVVRRDKSLDISAGGILLPETAKEAKPQIGTIVSVGPGKRLENGKRAAMDLQVGQRVIMASWAGLEVRGGPLAEESEYVMLREDDVVALA